MKNLILGWGTLIFALSSCAQSPNKTVVMEEMKVSSAKLNNAAQATFGAGCFWCVEAVFQELEGVLKVESGYSNGHVKNPSYKEVCTGNTGHVEVARIYFDPHVISYEDLLAVFWRTHNPTTLNQQGNDVGTQYRSGIYYHNTEQQRIAQASKEAVESSGLWENTIVTEIVAIDNYSVAEDYHQNYYNNNPYQGYCTFVIGPKVEKFRKEFKDKLKSASKSK